MSKNVLVFVFGEDKNDSAAIGHLIRGILPAGSNITIRPLRDPPILRNDSAVVKRQAMSEKIFGIVNAFQRSGANVLVVAHRDCDDIEPAHVKATEALEASLRQAGIKFVVAATPAWEIETWWMLFPEVFPNICSSWSKIDYGSSNVGMISNSKERLARDLRSKSGKRAPEFREQHGIDVARFVAENRELVAKIRARCGSFENFNKSLCFAHASLVEAK